MSKKPETNLRFAAQATPAASSYPQLERIKKALFPNLLPSKDNSADSRFVDLIDRFAAR